jgi:DNA processing protein
MGDEAMELSGFWAAAVRVGTGLDFDAMASGMGSYAALERANAKELKAIGVPASRAEAWSRQPSIKVGWNYVTLADNEYPERIRVLPDAPPVIFYEGDLSVVSKPSVSIVGTRRCTAYGVGVARHLSSSLAAVGVVIVSGLARGIDTHAHAATLDCGNTIAVLGHGLAHTAPASNRGLRRRIVRSGGLVLSTWMDDVEPRPFRFPQRNRWIAALGSVVVVVEAARKSGAKITAEQAWSIDKRVVVVPGALGAPASRGCLDLLRLGADVMLSVDEFVAGFGVPTNIAEDWKDLLFLGRSVTEVARVTGRPITELFCTLATAEAAGEVVRLPGQRYARGNGSKK